MKKIISYAFVLLLLIMPRAKADVDRIITLAESDLQAQQLREIAAEFFSVKCGLSKENLLKADMEMQLTQKGYWKKNSVGHTEWYGTEEPRWTIHVKSFPGVQTPHEGMHLLYLNRGGSIIAWKAHGAEHSAINPDLMNSASAAVPLPTDAQENQIIDKTQNELKKKYGVHQADAFIFKTAFVYEEHFNWGKIPVWLVNIYDGEALAYKAVYAYDGRIMSLVPSQQDYTCYITPDEEFFVSVFKERWADEAYKAASINDGLASKADAQKWLSDWAELFQEWATKHPYSAKDQLVYELLKQNAALLTD